MTPASLGDDSEAIPLGFGCWGLSGDWGIPTRNDDVRVLLNEAWNSGVRYFDTAAIYADGFGESMFRDMPWRHEAVIATKVSARVRPEPPVRPIGEYYTARSIARSVDESLARLQVVRLDVLQLHNWYPEWDGESEEVLTELARLKLSGKIRKCGVSLPRWPKQHPHVLFKSRVLDMIQAPLNMVENWITDSVLESAIGSGVEVVGRAPLLHGALVAGNDADACTGTLNDHPYRETVARGAGPAVSLGCPRCRTTRAFAYALNVKGITAILVGMRSVEHLAENAGIVRRLLGSEYSGSAWAGCMC